MSRTKLFWCSVLVTLFCLVPLYILILGGSLFGASTAGTAAEDVPILTAGEDDTLTLLLIVNTPEPTFHLVRLDAYRKKAECLILPADTVVLQDGRSTTLAESLAYAGPLQVRSCLAETAGTACERYLELDAETLASAFNRYTVMLDWNQLGQIHDLSMLKKFAYNGGKSAVTASTAVLLLNQSGLDETDLDDLRARLYGAFLQKGLEEGLADSAVTLLRSDESFSTDISAVDIYGVQRLLQLLAQDPPAVECSVLTGRRTSAGYEISGAGLRELQSLLEG